MVNHMLDNKIYLTLPFVSIFLFFVFFHTASAQTQYPLKVLNNTVDLTHACTIYDLNLTQLVNSLQNNWLKDYYLLQDLQTLNISKVKVVYGNLNDLKLYVALNETYNETKNEYGYLYANETCNTTWIKKNSTYYCEVVYGNETSYITQNCTNIYSVNSTNDTCEYQYYGITGHYNITKWKWKWINFLTKKGNNITIEISLNDLINLIYQTFKEKNIMFKVCGDYNPVITKNGWSVSIDHIPSFLGVDYSNFTWWNSSWQYRRPITIQENSGNTLTDYQVKLTIDTASLISAGKMNSDCSDMRFTDDNDNSLSYWIKSGCNSANTIVWVKVPNIPASSTATIYMYYGNPSATSESNPNNVFDLYDDFSESSLDTSKWNSVQDAGSGGSATISDGVLIIYTGQGTSTDRYHVYSKTSFGTGYIFQFDAYVENWGGTGSAGYYRQAGGGFNGYNRGSYTGYCYKFVDTAGTVAWGSGENGADFFKRDNSDSVTVSSDFSSSYPPNQWHTYVIKRLQDKISIDIDGHSDVVSFTSGIPTNSLPVGWGTQHWGSTSYWNKIHVDNAIVRKYTDPEPTATVGPEETSNQPPSVDEPKTYDENLNTKTSFNVNELVRIRVNVSDPQGASDIDKVLITILDNSSNIMVNNDTMTNVSSITNGYTYEYNYTIPSTAKVGYWSIKVYANDTQNAWGYNNTTFEVLDTTPPTIKFVTKIPQDINSLNAYDNGVNITYNITDDSAVDEVWLYSKTNSTDTNIMQYVNGTAVEGWFKKTNYSLVGDNYTFTLNPDDIYPGTFNIKPEDMKDLTRYVYSLDNNNQYIKIRFLNVSNYRHYNDLLLNVQNKTSNSGDLRLYYCNSSYTTGKPTTSNYCYNFYNLPASVPKVSYPGTNITYFVIPLGLNSTTGYIGDVKVTSTSYILLRGPTSGDGWDVYYVTNVTRPDTIQTSGSSGNTWSDFSGTIDAHLHQFSDSDMFYYYVCANDTYNNTDCSSIGTDLIQLAGLPPSAPEVYSPTEGYYTGLINISYTEAISPNEYPIVKYNISLINLDLSYNMTITSDNDNNLNYIWNSSEALTGQYFIKVTACDNQSQCSFGLSDNITIYHITNKTNSINVSVSLLTKFMKSTTRTLNISTIPSLTKLLNLTRNNSVSLYISLAFNKLLNITRQLTTNSSISLTFNKLFNLTRPFSSTVLISPSLTKLLNLTRLFTTNPSISLTFNKLFNLTRYPTQTILLTPNMNRWISIIRIPSSNVTITNVVYAMIGAPIYINVLVTPTLIKTITFARFFTVDINVLINFVSQLPTKIAFVLKAPPYVHYNLLSNIYNLIYLAVAILFVIAISTYYIWKHREELWGEHPAKKYENEE